MIPVPLIDFLEVDRWGDATLWVPVPPDCPEDVGVHGEVYGTVEPDGRAVVA